MEIPVEISHFRPEAAESQDVATPPTAIGHVFEFGHLVAAQQALKHPINLIGI